MSRQHVPDTIRERLHKIKALHDAATTPGEREAAENRLNALLDEYDLSIEDLTEPAKQDYEFRYHNSWQRMLLRQIVAHVTGDHSPKAFYFGSKQPSTRLWFELTPAQAIDVETLYQFYWHAFEEEVYDFMAAFIHKHDLAVAAEESEGERPQMTPEELKHWLKLCQLQQSMQDRPSPLAGGYLTEGGAN